MRPIEFRYRFKNRKTNQLIIQIMDISSIENRAFWPNPFGNLEWEILSRDEFTGLLDKNGKKIFEGDILDGCERGIHTHSGRLQRIEVKIPEIYYLAESGAWYNDTVEVIGNIYENPDLLEAK